MNNFKESALTNLIVPGSWIRSAWPKKNLNTIAVHLTELNDLGNT